MRRSELVSFASSNERPATRYSFRGDPQELIFVNENGQFNVWDGVGRTSITLPDADMPARNGVLHRVSDVLLPRGVLTLLQMLRARIDFDSEFAASAVNSNAAGLLDDASTPYTVFVPVNGSGAGALSSAQVRRHIVPGELRSDNFTTSSTVTPLTGSTLTLRQETVNGRSVTTMNSGATRVAVITDVDFWASNGVIHVVDRVIA